MRKPFDQNKHLLHNEHMDHTHREFLEIYNKADLESDDSIAEVVTKLYHHSIEHFEKEQELMQHYGYPRKREHTQEHERTLAQMRQFLAKKDSLFGKKLLRSYYLEALPEWFDLHLISMDSDLAHFLAQR